MFNFSEFAYDVNNVLENIQDDVRSNIEYSISDAVSDAFSWKDDDFESLLEDVYNKGKEDAEEDFNDELTDTIENVKNETYDNVKKFIRLSLESGRSLKDCVSELDDLTADGVEKLVKDYYAVPVHLGDEIIVDGRAGVVVKIPNEELEIEKGSFYIMLADGTQTWVCPAYTAYSKTGRHHLGVVEVLNSLKENESPEVVPSDFKPITYYSNDFETASPEVAIEEAVAEHEAGLL